MGIYNDYSNPFSGLGNALNQMNQQQDYARFVQEVVARQQAQMPAPTTPKAVANPAPKSEPKSENPLLLLLED